jgi:N-acetylmuramoyl-L-alanine amidase
MRWIGILLFFFLTSSLVIPEGKVTVVIDAGHGGHDPGHLSHQKGLMTEKGINLKIANNLGGYIEKYLGNVKVLYTRKDDRYLSLDERVDLANNSNADYFLSVHCNGNPKSSVHGTESHVHNFQAKQSYALAKDMEQQFSERAGRHSRGIKNNDDRAHSIQVLKFTKMTSVLVECGFITNRKEANYLNGTYGQEIIASAIFRAFRKAINRDFPSIDFTPGADIGDYEVMIMSSKSPISMNHESFRRLDMDVNRVQLNTSNAYKYSYSVGPYKSKEEASQALNKVKTRGFPDAYISSP